MLDRVCYSPGSGEPGHIPVYQPVTVGMNWETNKQPLTTLRQFKAYASFSQLREGCCKISDYTVLRCVTVDLF